MTDIERLQSLPRDTSECINTAHDMILSCWVSMADKIAALRVIDECLGEEGTGEPIDQEAVEDYIAIHQ